MGTRKVWDLVNDIHQHMFLFLWPADMPRDRQVVIL
jgi:hypothetical protein